MDPLTIAAGIGAVSNIAGGLFGASSADKARRAQEEAARAALAEYAGISIPTIESQLLNLLTPEVVGQMTPEELSALSLGPSGMEQVAVPQELKQKQMETLAQMEEISKGGMTEADAAAMRQIQRQSDAANRARQAAVLNEMAQRGALGSGMELAARLQGTEAAQQAQSEAADRLAQELMGRRMSALQNVASQSGSLRSQEFGEQSDVAKARDAINQFNIQNRQNIIGQNVQARNLAQQQNLAARQAAADARVNILNQQQQANKALQQQQFANQMDIAKAKAAAHSGVGAASASGHNALAQMYGGVGGALANIAGSWGSSAQKSKDLATELELAKLKKD